MKLRSIIQARYIIAIAVTVSIVMIISALVELEQSRSEILNFLQEEAFSLAETIDHSSLNNLLSSEEIERALTERLFNNAYFVARLDSIGGLRPKDLAEIAAANNIFRINIFDQHGNRILGSHSAQNEHANLQEKHTPKDFLATILKGKTDKLIIGLKGARFEEGQRYAVAIRRTRQGGGAIVLNIDATELLEFRKKIGIGKLIQNIGDNSGIEYIALQDEQGIIAATGLIDELSSIESDTLLKNVFEAETTLTRIALFQDREVYEIMKPFIVNESFLGIFRIGLSMDGIRTTEERMQKRIIIMSIVLAAIGILIVTVIVANQNFRIIQKKYSAIQTFTGNILAQMQDAVVTIDADERITLFNKQAEMMFGIEESNVFGKRLNELDNIIKTCLLKIFAGDDPHKEQTIICNQHIQKIVSITLSITHGDDGSIESRTVVARDLTEAKRLEKEIQRRDKLTAMGELASGVAHEIRNPINAISMIAQRFEKEFKPQSDEQEYRALTTVLKSETHRINNIIRQFLDFSRPPKLNLQKTSFQEFIKHISTIIIGQTKSKGIRFNSSSTCDGEILIDQEQFTQAILNLLQNAIDATPSGGKITLSCMKSDRGIQIIVADTGIGIPKEMFEMIFDLYHTTKHEGTGMGLAITQQIITQHGGSISVDSEEGKGTKFIINLPDEG